MRLLFITLLTLTTLLADKQEAEKALDTAEKVVDVIQAVQSVQEMEKQIEQIKKDIKEDGHNYKVSLSYTYFAYENFRRLYREGWGLSGDNSELRYATLGISFLPNTWNIKISTSKILKEEAGTDGTFQFATQYGSKKDTEFTNVYMKPITRSWGDVGFGYMHFIFTNIVTNYNGGGSTFQVVDVATAPAEASIAYTQETTRYYITYNVPTTSWLPRGFGFKYEQEETDHGMPVAIGKYAHKPQGTISRLGLGISLTDEELESGFSFKNLYYSRGQNSYEYFDYSISTPVTFELTSQKIDMEIALAKRWENGKIIYTSFGATRESFDKIPDAITELKFNVGTVF